MPDASNIQGDLHVDRYLTNWSQNFIQDASSFIMPTATTIIPVAKQSDLYVTYDKGYFWRDDVEPRPLGGQPKAAGYKFTSSSYNAIEYGLEHLVDDRQRTNADAPIALDTNAARLLSQKHLIKADLFWATNFFKASVFTTDRTGVASSPVDGTSFLQFNDANSDPIGEIDKIKDAIHILTGFMPNTMVIGSDVKRELRSHPDIADRIKYTETGLADEGKLGALFEIPRVVTARSIYNSAQEGDTDSLSYIVNSKGIWIGYIDPTPAVDSPTAIATFAWTGLLPGATNAIGGVMERGRDGRAHSDWFQMRMAWDMKVVSPDLGAFMASAVA